MAAKLGRHRALVMGTVQGQGRFPENKAGNTSTSVYSNPTVFSLFPFLVM